MSHRRVKIWLRPSSGWHGLIDQESIRNQIWLLQGNRLRPIVFKGWLERLLYVLLAKELWCIDPKLVGDSLPEEHTQNSNHDLVTVFVVFEFMLSSAVLAALGVGKV